MNDLLPYVYYSLPWLFVIGLSLAAVLGIGVGLVWPRFLVYPYLLVFFWVNSTSYGNLAVFASRSIYSRGSGMLFFGVVLWYVLGAWLCARMSASFMNNCVNSCVNDSANRFATGRQRQAAPACNLRPWFLAWAVLLAAHVGVGLATGVPLAESLAPSGFSNIVWMAPLISLMLLAFRTREQALELARFIMLAGLARALFGLGRWAVSGGDPNNVYANMNAIQIRLTFFDINDSLLCTLAFAIAAVALFQAPSGAPMPAQGRSWRALAWATLLATTLCVVLSYRRTAWIGFLLAFAVVLLRFPPARRLQLGLAAMPLAGAAMAFVAARRLAQTRAAGEVGGGGGFLYDMQSRRFGPESERVLELKLAFADFLAHPLAGIGAWGRYHGYQAISWQGNPDGGLFLHSGVLHIALKSGLLGTVLLAGTIVAFIMGARRALRSLPPELLGLGAAGAAGLAFMIPDLLIGTPFPQVRTTQMLALCLSLPYLALAAAQEAAQRPSWQRPAWQRAPHRPMAPAP